VNDKLEEGVRPNRDNVAAMAWIGPWDIIPALYLLQMSYNIELYQERVLSIICWFIRRVFAWRGSGKPRETSYRITGFHHIPNIKQDCYPLDSTFDVTKWLVSSNQI